MDISPGIAYDARRDWQLTTGKSRPHLLQIELIRAYANKDNG
jgi:hypothetical protein